MLLGHDVSVQGLIWRVRVFQLSAASTRHMLLFLYIAFEYEGSGNFSLRGWQMVRFLYSPRRWSEWQAALSQSVQREAHPDFWFSSHYPPPCRPPPPGHCAPHSFSLAWITASVFFHCKHGQDLFGRVEVGGKELEGRFEASLSSIAPWKELSTAFPVNSMKLFSGKEGKEIEEKEEGEEDVDVRLLSPEYWLIKHVSHCLHC